jgi:protein TonB
MQPLRDAVELEGSMRARTLGVSLLVHAAAVAAILIAPLLAAPERLALPPAALVLVRPVPVPVPEVTPPAPAPVPPPDVPTTATPATVVPAPIVEPTSIAPPLFAPERADTRIPIVFGLIPGAGSEPQAPPGPPASGTGDPLPVGGDIERPQKIADAKPVYPPIARAAGIDGIVIVEAIIDETGAVRDARVLRSVPLLDQAALDAVRQWRFTPSTLNGVPVAVVMTVTVRFELR